MRSRRLKCDDRNKRDVVIFDIDGVLADNYARMEAYKANKLAGGEGWLGTVWEDFDPNDDPPHAGWVQLAKMLWRDGYYIILVTARQEVRREDTDTWMQAHGVEYDLLIMWPGPDTIGYYEYKREAAAELVQNFNVVLAVDDDPQHCRTYEELGVPALIAGQQPLECS